MIGTGFLKDFMNENTQQSDRFIELTQEGIKYSINEEKNTASVLRILISGDIIIPRSIYYNSKEYHVTIICSRAITYKKKIYPFNFQKIHAFLK